MEYLDLYFGVSGASVPIDHGYALYSAISRLTEGENGVESWFHAKRGIGLIPINGKAKAGSLLLGKQARFGIRLTGRDVPRALALSGQQLVLDGSAVKVGSATAQRLRPAAALTARLVTTKNGADELRFDAEIARQLEALSIRGRVTRGRRRVFSIHDVKVVGHELLINELTAEESIRLQEQGLGGRRKMGCGVFVPYER